MYGHEKAAYPKMNKRRTAHVVADSTPAKTGVLILCLGGMLFYFVPLNPLNASFKQIMVCLIMRISSGEQSWSISNP